MMKMRIHTGVLVILAFFACTTVCFASFGSNDNRKDRDKGKTKTESFSLKNFQRPSSFFSLSNTLSSSLNDDNNELLLNRFDYNSFLSEDNSNGVDVKSTIRVKSGNREVIYPFNYRLKSAPLSLFKTPTAR